MQYTQKDIDEILDDLYRVDPMLKNSQKELSQIIKQLLVAQPEAVIDQSFKIRLRDEILAIIEEVDLIKPAGDTKKPQTESSKQKWHLVFDILKPALVGVAAAFFIMIVIVPLFFDKNEVNLEEGHLALTEDALPKDETFNANLLEEDAQAPVIEEPANGASSAPAPVAQKSQVAPIVHPATLPISEELSIKLGSNPSTGFQWMVDFDDEFFELTGEEFQPNGDTGLVGSSGKHIFRFKALKKGQADITFSYIRPWEGEQTDTQKQIYQVTIK